jgi:hypothetical protein
MKFAPIALSIAGLIAGTTAVHAAPAPHIARAHAAPTPNYEFLGTVPVNTHWGTVMAANGYKNASVDDYIVLFKNADTGGVRECGNLSNNCIDVTPASPTPK